MVAQVGQMPAKRADEGPIALRLTVRPSGVFVARHLKQKNLSGQRGRLKA
jgi:hypothetical protein